MRALRFLVLAVFLVAFGAQTQAQAPADRENLLYVDLDYGRVVIRLRPDIAPRHVERVKELARAKFYDGQVFHRVIEGFMAQTGDPTGTGRGGSGRGNVGAARSQNPNSADSQFFIMFARAASLDGQYTVWGQVVSGMEHVDRIRRGEPPARPDRMLRVQVAADAPN
jgi:cyclophilin family peptidyl-prolyl cis-trans isomerase